MILYNSNKEFIGADESDLNALGFSNLAAMQAEAADFADLFLKTPGHVHNFKHVHWIDFVLCAKSMDESKAIIHANNNNYNVNLEVQTIYLSNAPATKAYMIILHNLRVLSHDEKAEINSDLENRITPQPAAVIPEPTSSIIEDEYDTIEENIELDNDEIFTIDDENIIEDEYEKPKTEVEIVDDPYESDDEDIEDSLEIDVYHNEDDEQEEDFDNNEVFDDENNFVFDPKKTAEALEMPISLIEEFVEDFINQALDFKEHLYNAVKNDDIVSLQSYSHKLKGVAANLRIDDALEILTKINKAKDFTTSKKDLDTFYQIMSKLSKNTIATPMQNDEASDERIELIDDDKLDILQDEEKNDESYYEDDELLIIEDDLELDDSSLEYDKNSDNDTEVEEDDDALVISDEFDELDDELYEIIDELENEETQGLETKEYNKQLIADEIGIDKESFDELFSDYINDSQAVISQIEEAIANDEAQTWKKLALNLKGMSDNMRVNNFVTDLEILITTNDSLDAKNALHEIQAGLFYISEAKD